VQRSFQVPGLSFFHDFVVTKNYYIFNAPPIKFNPVPFALGRRAPAECIEFASGPPNFLYIVPRDRSPIMKVPVDPHFTFHSVNGYEDEATGEVVMDVVWANKMELGKTATPRVPVWETVDFGAEVPFSTIRRYTLTPTLERDENGQRQWIHRSTKLSEKGLDFPMINPKVSCKRHRYVVNVAATAPSTEVLFTFLRLCVSPHFPGRYIYATYMRDPHKASPPQGLLKIDVADGKETSWMGSADEYLGEVVFAPKKNAPLDAAEDDGYLLSYLSDWKKGKSEFVVFDARDVAKGPIHRAALAVTLPHGLHGSFANGLTFEQTDILARWRAITGADKVAL